MNIPVLDKIRMNTVQNFFGEIIVEKVTDLAIAIKNNYYMVVEIKVAYSNIEDVDNVKGIQGIVIYVQTVSGADDDRPNNIKLDFVLKMSMEQRMN